MITLDGFRLLPIIAQNPELFADYRDILNAAAEKVILASLTDAQLDLTRARALKRALGDDAFGLALDHLGGPKLKSVLKKLDPNYKPAGDEGALRQRILGLVAGSTQPATAATRSPSARGGKTKGATKPAPELADFSRSMGAKARRSEG